MNRAERKKQLISQGALYRAQIVVARQFVHDGLEPRTLAKGALQQAALAAFSAIGTRNGIGLSGLNIQTVLPIATGVFSALAKRKSLVKAVLRGAVVAGSVAGLVALISRSRRAAREAAYFDSDDIADYGI
jgi:hypothetical protein